MPFISTFNGEQFAAESNETLLDAALRANVIFGYSCNIGRRVTCKSQVAVGNTVALLDESGLNRQCPRSVSKLNTGHAFRRFHFDAFVSSSQNLKVNL